MNLVLNTLGASIDSDKIRALLPEKEVEIIDTSDMKIAHCIGCNQCWLQPVLAADSGHLRHQG